MSHVAVARKTRGEEESNHEPLRWLTKVVAEEWDDPDLPVSISMATKMTV